MNIVLVDELAGHTNISIGNNCCIRGTIMIYKATSKVIIGDNVYIGPGTLIECVDEVTIGNDVMISLNCNIIDTNSHSLHSADRKNDTIDWQKGLAYKNWDVVETKKITIGNSCWIGLRSIIMKGVFLSEGTIVASGSVVTKSTEPYTIIGGNPAKFIKQTD
ncbi:MAG TPA: acyltransferase [Ferruginibacter sp.]|nr:acyltransferase [Ferruginibacter sp.]